MVPSCKLAKSVHHGIDFRLEFHTTLDFLKMKQVPEHLVETNMLSEVLQIQEFSFELALNCQ